MGPNKETRKRWAAEGIQPPSSIVDPDWRCPACGAPPDSLRFTDARIPEAVSCLICDLPFSLSQRWTSPPGPPVPLPAVSDAWVGAWRCAYNNRSFKTACVRLGGRSLLSLLEAFPSADAALEFFASIDAEAVPS